MVELEATSRQHKKPYIINCSSVFRDAVLQLAESKKVNVGDLARSIMLTIPQTMIENFPDPGEPAVTDREKITLKSGDYQGKIWRRKPRLQARLPAGYDAKLLRRALAMALALAYNEKNMVLQNSDEEEFSITIKQLQERNKRLHETIRKLAFTPLRMGCYSSEDALYILGLPSAPKPTEESIKKRFRELAAIFHPDGICGDHERMSQLNLALDYLKKNNWSIER